jgi:hypothetical protein
MALSELPVGLSVAREDRCGARRRPLGGDVRRLALELLRRQLTKESVDRVDALAEEAGVASPRRRERVFDEAERDRIRSSPGDEGAQRFTPRWLLAPGLRWLRLDRVQAQPEHEEALEERVEERAERLDAAVGRGSLLAAERANAQDCSRTVSRRGRERLGKLGRLSLLETCPQADPADEHGQSPVGRAQLAVPKDAPGSVPFQDNGPVLRFDIAEDEDVRIAVELCVEPRDARVDDLKLVLRVTTDAYGEPRVGALSDDSRGAEAEEPKAFHPPAAIATDVPLLRVTRIPDLGEVRSTEAVLSGAVRTRTVSGHSGHSGAGGPDPQDLEKWGKNAAEVDRPQVFAVYLGGRNSSRTARGGKRMKDKQIDLHGGEK